MKVIGLISAFDEETNIGPAVTSLIEGGCDRVVVVDGAWKNPDGSWFGDSPSPFSTDATLTEALTAGAKVVSPAEAELGSDGTKRDWALRNCGAEVGDHLLLLDADERLVGSIDPDHAPSGHGCLIHRDLGDNDLPGLGGAWPRGDWGPEKPLLRWLRWWPELRCSSPGVYFEGKRRIQPYLVGAMRDRATGGYDDLFAHAYRVVRDLEQHLAPSDACIVPIVSGVEIHHVADTPPERVAAKLRYYDKATA